MLAPRFKYSVEGIVGYPLWVYGRNLKEKRRCMNLIDLMPLGEWKRLQSDLHARYGLNADVMDAEGKRLAGVSWGNQLCSSLHDDAKGFGAVCLPAGQMFIHLMNAEKVPFAEECDAGMMRVSVPVVVDGEVLGAVGGCGLIPHDGEVDGFTIEMMSGLDEAAVESLAVTVAAAGPNSVEDIQTFVMDRLPALVNG